jgi:hypothetical protein
MKKVALLIALMLLISAFTFAVDFSASTYLTGNLWGTDGFMLNDQAQKDADLLTVSVSDEVWGSNFRLWAPLTGGADGGIVDLRKLNIWVKPIDMLKITVGAVDSGLYTEQLNWWQVPNGAMATAMGWSSDTATGGNGGVNLELTPMDDLWILAGISPGIGNTFMAKDADDNLVVGNDTNFGLAAKYTIADFGSAGVAYRNNGGMTAGDTITWNEMNFRLGFDVSSVEGLYAFLQAIFTVDAGAESICGVVIDEYVSYTAGDFNVKATFPVTVRVTGDTGDDSYMTYDVKAGYTVMENVTPFVRLEQQGAAILLDDIKFMPTIQLGADYSLGSVNFMTALQINVPDPDVTDAEMTWAIPFEMRASW